MSHVTVRELSNNAVAIIERARNGEEITITVDGVPAATLVPSAKKAFLTTEDLLAMAPAKPVTAAHPHDLEDDTTDDLRPPYMTGQPASLGL